MKVEYRNYRNSIYNNPLTIIHNDNIIIHNMNLSLSSQNYEIIFLLFIK